MADKVKETARQEVDRVKGLAEEAAKSGAYLYPLKVRPIRQSKLSTKHHH